MSPHSDRFSISTQQHPFGACASALPVILKTPWNNPRSLASIAATLHLIFHQYKRNEMTELYPNGNPDFSLPFFHVSLSKKGLTILIPAQLQRPSLIAALKELCETRAYVEKVTTKRLGSAEWEVIEKKYTGSITIPLEKIKSILENKLGFTRSVLRCDGRSLPFLEDLLDVHGACLTPEQKQTVQLGKKCSDLSEVRVSKNPLFPTLEGDQGTNWLLNAFKKFM